MEFDQRQEFRVNREMKKFFLDLGEKTSSEYLRTLVEKDILEKCNPEFIKNQIKQKKEEIKHLEELLSAPRVMTDKINDFLKKHAKGFKENAQHRTVEQRHRFIRDVILPEFKKFGYSKSVEEIDEILLNYPDNNGGNK